MNVTFDDKFWSMVQVRQIAWDLAHGSNLVPRPIKDGDPEYDFVVKVRNNIEEYRVLHAEELAAIASRITIAPLEPGRDYRLTLSGGYAEPIDVVLPEKDSFELTGIDRARFFNNLNLRAKEKI